MFPWRGSSGRLALSADGVRDLGHEHEIDRWHIVETHPEIGDKLLEPLNRLAGARPIVRHHHERWDGNGYPDRLAAEAIPLAARVVAVADSIEVMSSRQLYRKPLTPEGIVDELRAQRARQWDPEVVDVALALIESGELVLSTDGLRLLERVVA